MKKLYGTKDTYQCKTLIIATGAFPRPIGCKREGEFMGKGVSFCATCDANFFEDMEVYVVGGGDSAVEEAMYLTQVRKKGDHYPQKKRASCRQVHPGEGRFKNPKLHFMWDTVVDELHGDGILSGMTVRNTKTGELTDIEADPMTECSVCSDLSATIPEASCLRVW